MGKCMAFVISVDTDRSMKITFNYNIGNSKRYRWFDDDDGLPIHILVESHAYNKRLIFLGVIILERQPD